MARPLKLKVADVVAALRKARGLRSIAADALGVNVKTIDKYVARSAEAQDVIEHNRKARKDRAEFKLDEAIMRGESWAVMFTLKNARDREYGERMAVEIEPSQALFKKLEELGLTLNDVKTDPIALELFRLVGVQLAPASVGAAGGGEAD